MGPWSNGMTPPLHGGGWGFESLRVHWNFFKKSFIKKGQNRKVFNHKRIVKSEEHGKNKGKQKAVEKADEKTRQKVKAIKKQKQQGKDSQ